MRRSAGLMYTSAGSSFNSLFHRRAWAEIDLNALSHNWRVARERCYESNSNISFLPIIKANGYGHGLESVARQLMNDPVGVEGVAVAAVSEVIRLRNIGLKIPIVLLPGFVNKAELEAMSALQDVEPVVHSKFQVDMLLERAATVTTTSGKGLLRDIGFSRIWLKANTGMNRLGLQPKDWLDSYEALRQSLPGAKVIAMSHLSCADELQSSATPKQIRNFEALCSRSTPVPTRSFAASGGILAWPQTRCEIARPGIMLYGSSPFADKSAAECGLKPVMTLRSRVITVNSILAGDSVGYGATFVADRPMRIAVVSIGYADGYPRSALTGTPVLVNTKTGFRRARLVGRVSMDMITVDVTDLGVEPDAEVVLWGKDLPAEEVAERCGTISYELFCQVTPRVPRIEISN